MSRESRRREDDSYREWKGGYRPYDILREATIALGVVLALTVLLTILFSSPDDPPSTIKSWSRTDPVDFVTTAATVCPDASSASSDGTAACGVPARPGRAHCRSVAWRLPGAIDLRPTASLRARP